FSRITGNKLSPAPSSPTTSIIRHLSRGAPPQTDGVGPVRQRGHFQQHFDFGDEGAWIRQPEGRTKCVERDHCPLLVQFQPAVLRRAGQAALREARELRGRGARLALLPLAYAAVARPRLSPLQLKR